MCASSNSPFKVMIVDDSAVVRTHLSRIIDKYQDIEIVGRAYNGRDAIQKISEFKPEVIILDVEMPFINGIDAIPELLKIDPKVKIIMFSTLTLKNAEISLEALKLGAVDYIGKPTAIDGNLNAFEHDLIEKIRWFADLYRGKEEILYESKIKVDAKINAVSPKKIEITKGLFFPKAIAIGSSTGGPGALMEVLKDLKTTSLPIFITQHMPPNFTKILAKNIEREIDKECVEVTDGLKVKKDMVYVAQGDYHLTLEKEGDDSIIRLCDGAPENYCRPAVDVMFRSLSDHYEGKCLGVILTGMGQDGLVGSAELVKNGGRVIAQDKETSVVWGMPGAVAKAEICDAILPLDTIANYIKSEYKV